MTGEPVWRTEESDAWSFALLGASLRQLAISPRRVVHVGANHGEEIPHYRAAGLESITLVEPDPASCQLIRDRPDYGPDVAVIRAACGKAPGWATFYRNAKPFFSGLVERDRGPDRTTDSFQVQVTTVRHLTSPTVPSMLVVDAQGSELDVLVGADLQRYELVICEAWGMTGLGRPPKVRCGPNVAELEAYMALRGWVPALRWVYDGSGYFDQLYRPRGSDVR